MRHRDIGRFNRNFMWSILAMAIIVLMAAGMFLYLCVPSASSASLQPKTEMAE
ncbi:MAG: hypothetical protein ACI4B5_07520 [Bacteroidaceae bacterium]